MGKEFNQPTQNYKPEGELDMPYLRARQEWDERIGSARVQAANWRLFSLGVLLICIILTCGYIYTSSKCKIVPYIVRVSQDGSAQAIGPAQEISYIPQEAEIKYFLNEFVEKARSLPLDPIVVKQNWLYVYSYLSQSGALKMTEYVNKEKPTSKIGAETVQVEITSINALTQNSYQVEWNENKYSKMGEPKESYKMTGLFTLVIVKPDTEKNILRNPLGLYISNFSWSSKIGG